MRKKREDGVGGGYVSSAEDGAFPHLQDMRHVWNNVEGWDKTEGQKNARALLKEDRGRFSTLLQQLEKENRLVGNQEKEEVEDRGLEDCVEMCVNWLEMNGT